MISRLTILLFGFLALGCSERFDNPYPMQPAEIEVTHSIKQLSGMYTGHITEVVDSVVVAGVVVQNDEPGILTLTQDGSQIDVVLGIEYVSSEYKSGQTVYVSARHLFLGVPSGRGATVRIGLDFGDPYDVTSLESRELIRQHVFKGTLPSR